MRKTVYLIVPVRIEAETKESLDEHLNDLKTSNKTLLEYFGGGIKGLYSVKSGKYKILEKKPNGF